MQLLNIKNDLLTKEETINSLLNNDYERCSYCCVVNNIEFIINVIENSNLNFTEEFERKLP